MTYVLVFIFGLLIGSSINALDWRIDRSDSWTKSRSKCPHCGHTLSAWELVPLISFIVLGGRCRACNQAISWHYPLVELATGLTFLLSFQMFGLTFAGLAAVILSALLIFIYLHDGRTLIIPNPAVWSFNLLAFLLLFVDFQPAAFVWPSWLALAAGPAVALPLFLIWYFSGGRGMGFADGKLGLGIGWLLGLFGGVSALIFSFWAGAVISLGLLAGQWLYEKLSPKTDKQPTMETAETPDRLTLKSAVPFGPFMILGFMLVYFGGFGLF